MSIQDELQALMNTMAEAYRAGDAAGCASLFVQDGELHSPYAPPARGRAAIEVLHQEWTRGGENKQLTVNDAGSSGDLAWCHTAYSEGDVSGDGTSLSVLTGQTDGQWLIRICMLNSDVPTEHD